MTDEDYVKLCNKKIADTIAKLDREREEKRQRAKHRIMTDPDLALVRQKLVTGMTDLDGAIRSLERMDAQ